MTSSCGRMLLCSRRVRCCSGGGGSYTLWWIAAVITMVLSEGARTCCAAASSSGGGGGGGGPPLCPADCACVYKGTGIVAGIHVNCTRDGADLPAPGTGVQHPGGTPGPLPQPALRTGPGVLPASRLPNHPGSQLLQYSQYTSWCFHTPAQATRARSPWQHVDWPWPCCDQWPSILGCPWP